MQEKTGINICFLKDIHRRLYGWVVSLSESPYSSVAMAALAFSEAIFFPVPADVLLVALCLGQPKRSFYFGFICVSFSILGGAVAFGLGTLIGYENVLSVFERFYLAHKAELAFSLYRKYDFWAVATAALTPVPYMVFSWLGGIAKINFFGFLLTSIVFRSIRFFSEATIIYIWGEKARLWIERYFNLATIIVILLLIVIAVILKKLSTLFGF